MPQNGIFYWLFMNYTTSLITARNPIPHNMTASKNTPKESPTSFRDVLQNV